MAVTRRITIRIGRLTVEGSPGEAQGLAAALKSELARLVAASDGLPPGLARPAALRAESPLRAVTPAGRGREAARRLVSR